MNVVIVVVTRIGAGFIAQSITGDIVCGGDAVDDSLLQKCL
jgi:hypothetical protein